MQQVTIIPADRFVAVDGRGIHGIDTSSIDPQIHAVQWYGQRGEIELIPDENGRTANIEITSLELFQPVLDRWQAAAAAIDSPPPPPLADVAAHKIEALSADCEAAIVSGFESSALGAPHTYQSDRDDQLNLVGASTAGVDMPFKCRDEVGVWAYRLHTAAQLKQVHVDGAAVKLAHLQRFAALREQVDRIVADTGLTEDEKRAALEAIVW